MSQLFFIATPIGNLSDITFRAIETLKLVDFIIAEDTRHSQKLLRHYGIEKPMTVFYAQSSDHKASEIMKRIQNGEKGAYISDAGTPNVSDPGYKLIRSAREHQIDMVPIPGPSALTTLLSVSHLPIDTFTFLGFLPHKKGRQTLIKTIAESPLTHILYESVHRFPRFLEELKSHTGGERQIFIGREMTKSHEELFRGSIDEAQLHFQDENTKGEFVIAIEGKPKSTLKIEKYKDKK